MSEIKIFEVINNIEDVLDTAEDNYHSGGTEDDYGNLLPGPVDFDKLKEDIINIVKQLVNMEEDENDDWKR